MQRIRVTYSKGEELMYTGNLDLHKVWERTFRRANLKIAYSQGFHPQPRLQQACPLPLGFTSQYELLDFWLDSDDEIDKILGKLQKAIQPGIQITQIESIPLEEKPLQTRVTAARYTVLLDDATQTGELRTMLASLQLKKTCIRSRRGKDYDLLPLIKSIALLEEHPICLDMTLSATPGATGRPEEVLDELGIDFTDTSIVRTQLILDVQVQDD